MSGLPSGYKQLEYIQSTGTQHLDTLFKPNNHTRVVIDFRSTFSTANSPKGLLGSRNISDIGMFAFLYSNRIDPNYNGVGKSITVDSLQRHVYDFNQNSFSVDGDVVSFDAGIFSPGYNLLLLSVQNYGTIDNRKAEGYLYSCQIYDNGTLVRDFVPCKNASGAVGLYDIVEGQFYANAGTGAFTAGPEVVYEQDAPTNFAASVSGQTVALSWAAAANATGYRLKRDGVQIAEQTGTTYTDTVPDGTTLCTYALTAYNDAGESAAVTLLVLVQLELITDRTRADVANQTDKGFYNASDLNRVGAAVEYIAGRFTALGYACPVTVKKDWLTSDAPTASQMEAYRHNIVTLRGQIAVMQSTPDAPASMAGLDYVKANNIEQILLDLDALIDNITKSWYFSGELYAGEV